MLEKIKSRFITKIIFAYINEEIKLKLVKYNKTIQNLLDIKLINYKIFSGKYTIYEKEGKRKEYSYFNNKLLFEGTYSNGKRNGKGKEYTKDGDLIFEGEYSNGKRWTGTIYFDNGQKYELVNGKGIIKEYYEFKNVIFEGEYLNGEKNGKGKEYTKDDGLIFEGEYLNGKKWNGKGFFLGRSFDLKNGNILIKEYGENGLILLFFQYLNGGRNGKWILRSKEGKLILEADYLHNKLNGKYKKYYWNGKLFFEGECLNNRKIKGREYIKGILEYEGEYLYGIKWNGKGYDKKGNVIYELINGCGSVKEYDDDRILKYEGEYLDGRRHGKGKEYDDDSVIFEGEYLNGKRWTGKGIEYINGRKLEVEYLNGEKLK